MGFLGIDSHSTGGRFAALSSSFTCTIGNVASEGRLPVIRDLIGARQVRAGGFQCGSCDFFLRLLSGFSFLLIFPPVCPRSTEVTRGDFMPCGQAAVNGAGRFVLTRVPPARAAAVNSASTVLCSSVPAATCSPSAAADL